jgi:class 3 adenylate cyclase
VGHPSIPNPPLPSSSKVAEGEIEWCRRIVEAQLRRKPEIKAGRVLPGIEDLAIMEGRRIRAAFVYSDLHGFTKLVATQSTDKSFIFLNAFVDLASRLTKLSNGQVMDCAGDRVLSVFHRPLGDLSNEPVEDAVTFALYLQTVFNKVIGPAFTGGGLGQLSLAIGIDYGEAVVGCVGIRNDRRIVFLGDPANKAAKFQEAAKAGETVLSAAANARRPSYLSDPTWAPRLDILEGEVVLRIAQYIDLDRLPKVR